MVSLVLVPTRLSTRFAAHEGVFPLCLCGAFFLFSVSLVLFCERVLFSFSPSSFFFFPFCLFLFRHPRFAFLPFFLLPRSSRRQLVVFVQSSFVLFFVKGCSFPPSGQLPFSPLLFVPLFERGVEKKYPSLLGSFARVGVVFILF